MVRVRIRFGVWLVRRYAHVFVLLRLLLSHCHSAMTNWSVRDDQLVIPSRWVPDRRSSPNWPRPPGHTLVDCGWVESETLRLTIWSADTHRVHRSRSQVSEKVGDGVRRLRLSPYTAHYSDCNTNLYTVSLSIDVEMRNFNLCFEAINSFTAYAVFWQSVPIIDYSVAKTMSSHITSIPHFKRSYRATSYLLRPCVFFYCLSYENSVTKICGEKQNKRQCWIWHDKENGHS